MRMLRHYKEISIICKALGSGLSNTVTLTLSAILVGGIFYNILSVKLHSDAKLPLLIFRPAMSTLFLLLGKIFLLQAQVFREDSSHLRREWLIMATNLRVGRKFTTKLLKALIPLKVEVGVGDGILFNLKRSTKIKFYAISVTYTINALLGVRSNVILKV